MSTAARSAAAHPLAVPEARRESERGEVRRDEMKPSQPWPRSSPAPRQLVQSYSQHDQRDGRPARRPVVAPHAPHGLDLLDPRLRLARRPTCARRTKPRSHPVALHRLSHRDPQRAARARPGAQDPPRPRRARDRRAAPRCRPPRTGPCGRAQAGRDEGQARLGARRAAGDPRSRFRGARQRGGASPSLALSLCLLRSYGKLMLPLHAGNIIGRRRRVRSPRRPPRRRPVRLRDGCVGAPLSSSRRAARRTISRFLRTRRLPRRDGPAQHPVGAHGPAPGHGVRAAPELHRDSRCAPHDGACPLPPLLPTPCALD